MLLEAGEAVQAALGGLEPSSPEAAALIRIGLLNYAAGGAADALRALRSPPRATCGTTWRRLAARFGVSFEQACHRLTTLQRDGARGVPFFFLRVDPAGNVDKRFSAAGFPFARFGGSCPNWIVHHGFATPGTVRVQLAQLPDGGDLPLLRPHRAGRADPLGRAGAGACGGDGLRPRAARRR